MYVGPWNESAGGIQRDAVEWRLLAADTGSDRNGSVLLPAGWDVRDNERAVPGYNERGEPDHHNDDAVGIRASEAVGKLQPV